MITKLNARLRHAESWAYGKALELALRHLLLLSFEGEVSILIDTEGRHVCFGKCK
jgi:hypothetical protein